MYLWSRYIGILDFSVMCMMIMMMSFFLPCLTLRRVGLMRRWQHASTGGRRKIGGCTNVQRPSCNIACIAYKNAQFFILLHSTRIVFKDVLASLKGPFVTKGSRPKEILGPWDLRWLGLRVRGPKVFRPEARGRMCVLLVFKIFFLVPNRRGVCPIP